VTKSANTTGGKSYVLMLLAAIFFASGLSRLGLGVAEGFAADTPVHLLTDIDRATDPGNLYEALQARQSHLDERERALQDRAYALRNAEIALQGNLDQLVAAEARLAATLRLTESAAENDLKHLTTVFESMKPPQAADLFSQMDTEFAAGFVSRLRPDFAGEVMSALDPIIAYGISAVLAGRHARTSRN
jgi:flagellar motility protein MotE (MotC chaperone)